MPGRYSHNRDPELAELLHQVTLDGWANDSTGDLDQNGFHASLVIVEPAEQHELTDAFDHPIPAGSWLLLEDEQGFPAVRVDGRQLYDGGVVANVPVTQALAMGAQSLVVLDAAFPGRLPTAPATLAEALLFTAIVSMRVQAALEAPIAAARVPVVYLPGPAIHRVSPLQFRHPDMLIEGAYQAARPFLERLKINGPGLYGSPSGR